MPVSSPTAPARKTLDKAAPAPQHLQALAEANRVRRARAALKRSVASGDRCAREIILECPWEAASMTVSDLLTSQKRWGSTRCRKLLQCALIPENKTIGSMTERQRRALAQMLRDVKFGVEESMRRYQETEARNTRLFPGQG